MAHNPAWLINKHPKNLKLQIKELIELGYTVSMQNDSSAQLSKKKTFSCLFALITGFFPYLCYYMWKKDWVIYLDLDTQEPDPHWEKNRAERRKKIVKIVGIVFVASLLLSAIINSFGSN